MQVADRGLEDLLTGHTHRLERVARVRERVLAVVGDLIGRARDAGQVQPDVHALGIGMITLMVASAAEFAHDVRPDPWRRYLVLLLDGLRSGCADRTALPAGRLAIDELERALATPRPRGR